MFSHICSVVLLDPFKQYQPLNQTQLPFPKYFSFVAELPNAKTDCVFPYSQCSFVQKQTGQMSFSVNACGKQITFSYGLFRINFPFQCILPLAVSIYHRCNS